MKTTKLAISLFALMVSFAGFATEGVHLEHVNNNLKDKASLQRGARTYFNYCSGCHSLQYSRYQQVGEYLGIVDEEGKPIDSLIQDNLNFVTDKVTDSIKTSMTRKEGAQWFGVPPPDLTLVTRVRGKDWVYTYLKSFFKDDTKIWGVNNVVFPDVAMPHVLLPLQGVQVAEFKTVDVNGMQKKEVSHLSISEPGQMNAKAYDQTVTDLVNFLEYMGEPMKEKRLRLGVFVLLFLIVLTTFLYALKREYWKGVH